MSVPLGGHRRERKRLMKPLVTYTPTAEDWVTCLARWQDQIVTIPPLQAWRNQIKALTEESDDRQT